MRILIVAFCLIAVVAPTTLRVPRTTTTSTEQTTPPKPKCGYESCHPTKEGKINVHIVPHTHDDVGWLKTVDQYYFGSNNDIQKAGVQYILDSVVDALRRNPERRFIYVETAFFWKWWIKQHDFVKHQVKKFVNNGQLEFIGGGWSMNDEATTHYHSIIDQLTWGLRKLNDTFGDCGRPKIGWQIDPFGHSREMASIFSQLGYDGVFLGRIDYQDKMFRFKTKTPEGIWRGSDSLGNKSDIFTGVLYNNYAPPPGFCFDVLCDDDPIVDDKRSPEYNVDRKIRELFSYVANMSKVYQTNNVLITMGEDFNYQNADMWFKNLDKLINYANQMEITGSSYHFLYSTPSCYLKAVQEESVKNKLTWPLKKDDFFPYSSDPDSFWTGYFTSRPTLKRFERVGNNFLQICKQLYALTDLGPEDWTDLNALREAMGVLQHHDAVAGTEKEHVAHDYARILNIGIDECEFVAKTALSKLATKTKPSERKIEGSPTPPIPEIDFHSCLLTNISQCTFTETSDSFVVTVYNPLSRNATMYVRFPVLGNSYTVTAPNGENISVQLLPLPKFVLEMPGRTSEAKTDLVFWAKNIPPLGFKTFYVTRNKNSDDRMKAEKHTHSLKHEGVGIQLDRSTGLLSGITLNDVTIPITQEFLVYRGAVGDNREAKNRSSGAYIFRPNGTEAYKIAEKVAVEVYRGDLIIEVHQQFNEWISQIIRIYNMESFVEFDWIVGPIPEDDINGKEIITRFTTNLSSDSTFYTDSNGRELLKRVRNFRPTWKLDLKEAVAGNYYPVTSKILIRDPTKDLEVAVLTDRAQGGSSMNDGQIELMVHRNCLHDDAFGVGESLREEAFGKGLVARGSHYLVAGHYLNKEQGKSLAAQERELAQRKILAPWMFFAPTQNLSFEQYKSKYKLCYGGLNRPLPDNVQILTLEPWKGMSFLVRFEHFLAKDEDPELSKPVTVDLKGLFAPFEILWIRETTLGGNQWIEENKRMQFEAGIEQNQILDLFILNNLSYDNKSGMHEFFDYEYGRETYRKNQMETNDIYKYFDFKGDEGKIERVEDNYKIALNPMQIRTFIIEIQKIAK